MLAPLELDGQTLAIDILARRPALLLTVDGLRVNAVEHAAAAPGAFSLSVNGRVVTGWRHVRGDEIYLRIAGRTLQLRRSSLSAGEAQGGNTGNVVLSDMPGTVIGIHAKPGMAVAEGDKLLTIESMKLQVTVAAPRDGRIAEIHVGENASFDRGVPLVSLAPTEAGA